MQDIETAAQRRPWAVDGKLLLWVAALVIAATAALVLVVRFVAAERERDLRAWQVRLGIVADSRFAAVEAWLAAQRDELAGLAANEALQVYLSELALADDDPSRRIILEAQLDYLQNLLIVSGERAGFSSEPRGPEVGANVRRVGVAGLALYGMDGRPIVATPGMPPPEGRLADFLAGLTPGRLAILDIHLDAAGQPAMGFAAPIYAIQADPVPTAQVGWVVGVKQVADELFPLLRQPGVAEQTAEAVLVRAVDEMVEYISPLAGGTAALSLRLARNTPDLDAAFALDRPGAFGIRRDHRDREVLFTSRAFEAVPWVLIYKVDRAEALADSDARLVRVLLVLLLAVALAAVMIAAFWRHGSSRRAAAAAERYREAARRLEQQRNLLKLVTESQPTAIYILDAEGRYRFANGRAAAAAGLPPDELVGKPIANVLGPEAARRRLELAGRVLETGRPVSDLDRTEADGRLRVLQSELLPIEAAGELPRGVLVVEHDVTEVVAERERRSRVLGQLVRTLVGIVDRRDPYAAEHSNRVAALARAIAAEMGLSPVELETAETAGRLLNLGKILVAPELLTRQAGLSELERLEIRHSIQAGADLLEGVEFDGPVVETLRQAQARWDGGGVPPGLAGEDILVTARIVAVANAFVGMVSERAHRPALSVDRAIEALFAEAGHAYDRRVVAALVNHLDSRGGRAQFAAGG